MAIDAALAKNPSDFDALLKLLRDAGYEIKPGKIPALRGKNQKRFIRLDTLGSGYNEAELRAVLSGEKAHQPHKRIVRPALDKKVNLLVDIQVKLHACIFRFFRTPRPAKLNSATAEIEHLCRAS